MSAVAHRIYANSVRAGMIALLVNAFLLVYGDLSDVYTPQEAVIADWVFAILALIALPFYFRRSGIGFTAGLVLGLLFTLRIAGDPDFMAAVEQMPVSIGEVSYFVVAVFFSFVQMFSSYGALVLRRAKLILEPNLS